ncbi:carboxymuconolactone decarboxylase family protein [Nakamurella deserti]|uniref:carboxymuconolactone decarboxylase family protein n=1 Tax=Nakamurella deserti TaxID=2164074 RepID=UPI000DBE7118|nr:carboxymuconolactone decarboxylase family protein [Nakamurella deserti]
MTDTLVHPAAATEYVARQQLARVPITPPPGRLWSLAGRIGRRMYGDIPDNGWALARNRRVLFGILGFERRVASWKALDPQLKTLATLTAAVEIGCSWCVDFGWFLAEKDGLDLAKLQHVRQWRDSPLYSPVERAVIEFAEAMTATPPAVTDAMVAALRAELGDAATIELTAVVALENQRSRMNAALGLVAQGFSAACRLPGH